MRNIQEHRKSFFPGDQAIRLIIELPDSLRSGKIRLSFSHYFLANVVGTKIETEFNQKEMKDGRIGPGWADFLYRSKGGWSISRKFNGIET